MFIMEERGHLAQACRNAAKTRKDGNAVCSYASCFISPLLEESNDSEKESYLIVDTGVHIHCKPKELFLKIYAHVMRRVLQILNETKQQSKEL